MGGHSDYICALFGLPTSGYSVFSAFGSGGYVR